MDKKQLYQVPVPRKTDTYSPVSHKQVIETLYEKLESENMNVNNEVLNPAREGKQLIGYLDVNYNPNDELGMRVGFRNSYDKSMSVAFVAGSVVWICGNGMIFGDMKFIRKHTGAVVQELNDKIDETLGSMSQQFELSHQYSNRMKQIQVDRKLASELCGRLFIEQDIITSTQLSIIKGELDEPSHNIFREPNLWSFYNHTTHSLKKSHPIAAIGQHIDFHEFIADEFQLASSG